MTDLQTRALTAIQNGKVFTDDIRAKQRLANVNQLLTEIFAACGELRDLSGTSTGAETFEAVANALHDTQKALLLFYRHTLDENAAEAAAGS
jgi:hypothetical protein